MMEMEPYERNDLGLVPTGAGPWNPCDANGVPLFDGCCADSQDPLMAAAMLVPLHDEAIAASGLCLLGSQEQAAAESSADLSSSLAAAPCAAAAAAAVGAARCPSDPHPTDINPSNAPHAGSARA